MAADKTIYMRPGETLEIRYIMHEDLGKNATDWFWQPHSTSNLFLINGPGDISYSDPALRLSVWGRENGN